MTESVPKKDSNQKQRSDKGSWQKTTRDVDAWWLLAQQKYVRMDTLGEWFALAYAKAQKQELSQGKQVPWPTDHRHRMMATQRLVARWQQRIGVVDIWQPYKDQPAWVRLNQRGLEELHLNWPEILWPVDERWLRDDSKNWLSHTHRVNKARLALARGEIPGIPAQHIWHSEREIEQTLPARHPGVRLPHKVDGYVTLETETTWTRTHAGGNIERTVLPLQTTIGIELELQRKSFEIYQSIIFPDLLRCYDYTIYLATGDAYEAVITARRNLLQTDNERKRIRILRFEPV